MQLQQTLLKMTVKTPGHPKPQMTTFTKGTSGAVVQRKPPGQTNRELLLQKVHETWIEGVLNTTMAESATFDITTTLAPQAVFKHRDYDDYPLTSTTTNIFKVFQDMNRELLILGVPGAGKTILMLQLAHKLIVSAQQNEKQPIPVVFNLSSWALERGALADWIQNELRTQYNVSTKLAKDWVDNEKLLLLLDGLDEVAEQYRNDCVEVINQFRLMYKTVDLAVCSRIGEYEALAHKLDVQGAIVLEPLTEHQIQDFIAADELTGLQETMRADTALQEMAHTPFLLHSMAVAYNGMATVTLKLPLGEDNEADRRKHLFEFYVDRRIKQSLNTRGYTPRETRYYLSWLAHKMVQYRKSVFFIEYLQPYWLSTNRGRYLYKLGIRLVLGLFFWTVVVGLLGLLTLVEDEIFEPFIGVLACVYCFIWPVMGLIFGLVGGLHEITSIADTLSFDRRKFLRSQAFNLAILAVLLVIGMTVEGLVIWLIFSLAGLTSFFEVKEAVDTRSFPNQGIWYAARNALLLGLAPLLLFGLVGGLIGWLVGNQVAVVLGLFLGIGGFLGRGLADELGYAVIRHIVLRFVLYHSGNSPKNYAKFFEYTTSIGLLRKVGGGYIFRHRDLLEYFATVEHH